MTAARDELLTAADLADLLKVSQGTLKNWRGSNRGPDFFYIHGRRVVYYRSVVDKWLAEQPRQIERPVGKPFERATPPQPA